MIININIIIIVVVFSAPSFASKWQEIKGKLNTDIANEQEKVTTYIFK
jgi:hypothetical protein